MKKLKIAVIGSGSTYTPELVEGIINRKASLPVGSLYLMDIDEDKRTIVGNLIVRMIEKAGLDCRVVMTGNLDEALDGADFVLGQIRVGKLAARVLDEKIPLKYGLIGQETCGIGGFFKALRTVPVILDIARRMERLCPDAYFINFSNPSGILAEALLNFTKVKAVGLCNCPIGMITRAKKDLELAEIEVDHIGLNHLGFLTDIRSGGVSYFEQAMKTGAGSVQMQNIPPGAIEPDCLKAMGAIPSSYLQYYAMRRHKLHQAQEAAQTRGEICIELERELLEMYKDLSLDVKPELLNKRGGHLYSEAAISLVDAIFNDKQEFHVVNVLNGGAVDFMNGDDVLEIGAIVGRDGAKPVPVKGYKNYYVIGMMKTLKYYEKLTVEAAIEGDDHKALAALMLNPLVGDYDAAAVCYFEMKKAHEAYLPQFKIS